VKSPGSESFCLTGTDFCFRISEWADLWQIFGIACTAILGVIGVMKILHELKRIGEQRTKERTDTETAARLKRTEFFLNQHRRLFDDPKLYEVLCLLDRDERRLADEDMWNGKRKFLTFIEEIALLVRARQIDAEVAQYMFGYYACSARDGANFNVGIDPKESFWRIFHDFCKAHDSFKKKMESDPSFVPVL
jgi:hypothetical protein